MLMARGFSEIVNIFSGRYRDSLRVSGIFSNSFLIVKDGDRQLGALGMLDAQWKDVEDRCGMAGIKQDWMRLKWLRDARQRVNEP